MIYQVPAVLMIKKWASILNHGLDLDSDGPDDMIMTPTMKVRSGCKPSLPDGRQALEC
jgi:hypothetical protein